MARSGSIILLITALTSGTAQADTLILKDGKQIEWSSMTDKGETVELQLATGAMITVNKDDIDRVVFGRPEMTLTGASMTFNKKRKLTAIDVLSKVDPLKVLNGSAAFHKGALALNSERMVYVRLPSLVTPPTEYDLTVVAQRKSLVGEFMVGIIVGGKQTVISFDAYRNAVSGVMWYEQKGLIDNPAAWKGEIFGKQPRTLTFMVRQEGFVVRVDNQDIASVRVQDYHNLTQHPEMSVPDKSVILFGCFDGSFIVTRAILTTPK